MALRTLTLDDLRVDDEPSFAHVSLYALLKDALRRSGHQFLVGDDDSDVSRDRALFLNQTYWPGGATMDVLSDAVLTADEVTHIALHGVAARQVAGDGAPVSPRAFLFCESLASALDLYLVGRLLKNRPEADFLETQVPIMRDAAEEAGLDPEDFGELLGELIEGPDEAFEDLRCLLLDVGTALLGCRSAADAQAQLDAVAEHRFAPLLHHYQLSNWVLYCRAYGAPSPEQDARVAALDAELRAQPVSLAHIEVAWLGGVA